MKRSRSKQRTSLHKSQDVEIGIPVMDPWKHINFTRDADVTGQMIEVCGKEVLQIMESCERSFLGWMVESLSADQ